MATPATIVFFPFASVLNLTLDNRVGPETRTFGLCFVRLFERFLSFLCSPKLSSSTRLLVWTSATKLVFMPSSAGNSARLGNCATLSNCACSMGIGFGLGILGAIFFVLGDLTSRSYKPPLYVSDALCTHTPVFALLYVIGLLVSLTGTGFLVGFSRQLKQMFDPVRLIASIILLGCISACFFSPRRHLLQITNATPLQPVMTFSSSRDVDFKIHLTNI